MAGAEGAMVHDGRGKHDREGPVSVTAPDEQ